MKNKIDRETRDRNYSICIFGLEVDGDNASVINVLSNVYNKVISPTLSLAVKAKQIKSVPPVESLLEYGHILLVKSRSNKNDASCFPPIIVRFYTSVSNKKT